MTGGPLTRRLYFRGFGIVYLIAFLSLWSQIHGLIGDQGLLPANQYFPAVYRQIGTQGYRLLPSLCWISSSDGTLHFLCGFGVVLSVILFVGLAPRPTLILLWIIYLSLSIAGQDFLSFQWDTLLLEMTVCSLLYAPRGWYPDWRADSDRIAGWLLWGLAFKLMFLSGITKLLSGDRSWLDGTALLFHDFTQPIPSWPAWYAYQLPLGIHRVSLLLMFLVEVILPFLVFFGRIGRTTFAIGTIVLMVAIEALGNFGFFNLQTIVLCIPLLNDDLWSRIVLRRLRKSEAQSPAISDSPKWRTISRQSIVAAMLFVSLLESVSEISSTARAAQLPAIVTVPIRWADTLLLFWGKPWVLDLVSPFRTINGYGLFRVMTVQRNEIIVETSDDGLTWTACEFLYKPGEIHRAPPIVAPHMPRLDWQMWFAALNPRGNQHWLSALLKRILDGSPSVVRLIGHSEFQSNPPKYVRLTFYEYKFTTADQRQATGAWWNRTYVGNLIDPVTK